MNPYSIPPLISALLFLSLGLLIILKKVKKSISTPFILVCLITFWWQGTWTILFNIQDQNLAHFLVKFGYSGIIFIPFSFYHFVVNWMDFKKENKFVILFYFIGVIFLFLLWFTNYFIDGYYKYFFGFYPKAKILHPLYLFFLTVVALRILIILWNRYKEEILNAVKKNQVIYVFTLFGIYALASIDFLANYGVEFYPPGFIFVLISIILIAYSILRFHLMNINIIFKKTAIYSLVTGVLASVFVFLVIFITKFVSAYFGEVNLFNINLFSALFIAILFNPIRNRIQSFIDKIFYKKSYDYYETIQKISHDLALNLNLENIYIYICDTITSTLALKNIYLFSMVSNLGYKIIYTKAEIIKNPIPQEICSNSFLEKYLNSLKDVFVKDDLTETLTISQDTINNICQELLPFKGEAVVPIFINDKLNYFLILGEKLSGDIFTNEDMKLLNTISHQTAIAIQNAKLHQEKIRSEKLASIGMMSASFAHEIKNPLTSIKTFTQLLPEQYDDMEFRDIFSKIMICSVNRIDGLISDLLDFSSDKIIIDKKIINISKYLDLIVEEIEIGFEFEKNKIKFEKNYKDANIYMFIDEKKLRQALVNLISNGRESISSSRTDGILVIDIEREKDFINILIKDNGHGIDKDNLAKIFEPFFTTKTRGVGLGLAITKKIIENHGGHIEVDSVLGKGTIFTISLPA